MACCGCESRIEAHSVWLSSICFLMLRSVQLAVCAVLCCYRFCHFYLFIYFSNDWRFKYRIVTCMEFIIHINVTSLLIFFFYNAFFTSEAMSCRVCFTHVFLIFFWTFEMEPKKGTRKTQWIPRKRRGIVQWTFLLCVPVTFSKIIIIKKISIWIKRPTG